MSKTGHRKGERMNMAKQKLTDEQKRLDTDLWIEVAEIMARDALAKGAYMVGAEDRERMLR